MSQGIQVRRAQRGDLATLADLVCDASGSRARVDEAGVMEWLFGKGLMVAVQGESLVGVAAWQTENLVSVTDEVFVFPPSLFGEAGGALLASIESEAHRLMCEVNVLVLPAWTMDGTRASLQALGYEEQTYQDLHRIWREVLDDFMSEGAILMVKRLRDRMVMAPL